MVPIYTIRFQESEKSWELAASAAGAVPSTTEEWKFMYFIGVTIPYFLRVLTFFYVLAVARNKTINKSANYIMFVFTPLTLRWISLSFCASDLYKETLLF
jgi:hypothetical protein